ncbi:MAG: isoprenylcysteine carboxylmethyltransferase family protein [Lysobacterales bacterium]
MKFKIEDLAGRVALAAIFLFFAVRGLHRLETLLANPWASDTWLLDFVIRIAGFLFALLLVATTVIRLPAKNSAVGLEPRISAILGSFLTLLLIVLPKGEISAEAKVLATVIIFCGTGLSIYCLYWLGRSFSVMAHARRLVTAGPYSFVRHPLYAAEMITLMGITLANFSFLATLVFATTIAFQFRRMANEEKVLRATFPEYDDYSRRVPMIIPALTSPRSRQRE